MNEKRVDAPLPTPQHGTPSWYHIDRTRDGRPVQLHPLIPHFQPFRRLDRQDKPMPGHVGQTKFTAGRTITVTSRLQCPSIPSRNSLQTGRMGRTFALPQFV